MSSVQGDYWQFEAIDSGQTQIIVGILKTLSAEEVQFWRDRIVESLDHYIKTLNSNVTEKKGE